MLRCIRAGADKKKKKKVMRSEFLSCTSLWRRALRWTALLDAGSWVP
jgi:hypothetical protein